MDDIIELLLSLLLMPFQSKIDKLNSKTEKIPNKAMKTLVKVLLPAVLIVLIVGLCGLCSYLFRGYWI